MGRQRLGEQRAGRHRQLERQRHDLELVVERGGDQLDDLADRQHLLVADVEHLPGCRRRLVDRQQDPVGQVLGVAVMVQGQPVVGDHDAASAVEDAPHDAPLPRRELVRAVHVRVAEVRGVGMEPEHRLLGAGDPVALLVLGGLRHRRGVLADRHRQPGRVVQPGVHPAPVRRHAPHRHEPPHPAARHRRDASQPPVHRHHDVEGVVGEPGSQRRLVVRVAMQMAHRRWGVVTLVQPPVQDRHVVAPLDQPGHDRHAGRAGAAHDQGPFGHRRAARGRRPRRLPHVTHGTVLAARAEARPVPPGPTRQSRLPGPGRAAPTPRFGVAAATFLGL